MTNVVMAAASFVLECTSYISLKPNWSQGDIDYLSWDVTRCNVQNVTLDDTHSAGGSLVS